MTRQQALEKLKDPRLDSHTRESLQQYLHYLSAENIQTSAKRPAQKNKKRNHSAGKTK